MIVSGLSERALLVCVLIAIVSLTGDAKDKVPLIEFRSLVFTVSLSVDE